MMTPFYHPPGSSDTIRRAADENLPVNCLFQAFDEVFGLAAGKISPAARLKQVWFSGLFDLAAK